MHGGHVCPALRNIIPLALGAGCFAMCSRSQCVNQMFDVLQT